MKRTIYTILAALLLTATGCEKPADRLIDKIVGEWHYTAEENGVAEDVWLSFGADGTFEIYQKLGEGPYWHSTGEYTADPATGILTGVYSDRYPWKYSYKVEAGTGTLQMSAVEIEGHTVTYTRETIPAEVRDKSVPLTKADAPDFFL